MIKENRNIGNVLFDVLNIGLFILFTLICIFPFYYIFINTISDNNLASTGKILFYPKGVQLDNYAKVIAIRGLAHAAFISVSRTVLGTILTLLGSTFIGYAMSRKEYWMRKFWYRYLIVTMYFSAGMIPWYVMMKTLGMINNFLAYIIPGTVSVFYVILFKTYVEQIPASLEESAQIDGAGYLVRFFNVILPLSVPILATIAVFTSVGQWNTFMDTLFLMRSEKLYTLQYLLYQYLNEVNALAEKMRSSPEYRSMDLARRLTPTTIRMTISIVVILPILCVYPFMQRFFVKGIMIGAIKG